MSPFTKCLIEKITEDRKKAIKEGKLADLAPTLLQLMGLDKPAEMTGESLII